MKNNDQNKIILSGGVVNLDKYVSDATLEVSSPTIINAINNHNNVNFKIKVADNANLTLNMFDYAIELKNNIIIELGENSRFIFNDAFISEIRYELDIEVLSYGSNTYSEVNIRGINEEKGTIKITAKGVVAGETEGIEMSEYAKIINKSDASCVLIPELIVNTNEVVANHGITISEPDKDQLFYLLSKGIDKHHASKILEEGFLLSIMSSEIKERIKNILIGR